jgi:hypothetical protein
MPEEEKTARCPSAYCPHLEPRAGCDGTLEGNVQLREFVLRARRVRDNGEEYPGGTYLRRTAGGSAVLCRACGPLEPETPLPGWTTDWLALAQLAREHVRDAGAGHWTAISLWQGAVYGPDGADEEEDGVYDE